MVGTMSRLVAITLLVLGAILVSNALWQRIHCHEPWAAVAPMQVSPCEPVEQLEEEMACLRKLAEQSKAKIMGEP